MRAPEASAPESSAPESSDPGAPVRATVVTGVLAMLGGATGGYLVLGALTVDRARDAWGMRDAPIDLERWIPLAFVGVAVGGLVGPLVGKLEAVRLELGMLWFALVWTAFALAETDWRLLWGLQAMGLDEATWHLFAVPGAVSLLAFARMAGKLLRRAGGQELPSFMQGACR